MTWFTRFWTPEEVPEHYLRLNKEISGTCVHVADGDTIRLWHEPILRFGKMPARAPLKEWALPIRLAGVDAPEMGKQGRPPQAGAEASRDWLKGLLIGKKITVVLHRRDQYDRLVGTVLVRKGLFKKNVSVMSLRKGMSCIYRAGGAEYGGYLEEMERAQEKAKTKGRGIWGDPDYEDPGEYKKRVRNEDKAGGGERKGSDPGRAKSPRGEKRRGRGQSDDEEGGGEGGRRTPAQRGRRERQANSKQQQQQEASDASDEGEGQG